MQRLRALALISLCGLATPSLGQDAQSGMGPAAKPPELTSPVPTAPDIELPPPEPLPVAESRPSQAGEDASPDSAPSAEPIEAAPVPAASSTAERKADVGSPDGLLPAPTESAVRNGEPVSPPGGEAKPALTNLWDQIRSRFSLPTINDPLVEKWENFYASRPDYWERINERGKRYLHYIAKEIERRAMPLEIALLPVIESAFNPEAYSRARAVGIWQFIPTTGKLYGLEQNWWQDNRRDVGVATKSALDYLQKLHDMFSDWHLALAAYNWGEGAVQRAIERNRAHGKPTDWASLRIPTETRNYLPKLQAVKNIVLAPEKFGLSLPDVPDAPYFVTVTTHRQIDVALAAKLADMRLDEFKVLNPAHNRPVVAGIGDQRINLPRDKAELFVMNLDSYQKPLVSWRPYRVKDGEKLQHIAPRFGMDVDELKRVNGLDGRKRIVSGYTLLVPATGGATTEPLPISAFKEAPAAGPGWHRVRRGETLARIADRYGVDAGELKRLNGLSGNAAPAGARLRLFEGVALGASRSAPSAKDYRGTSMKSTAVKVTPRQKLFARLRRG